MIIELTEEEWIEVIKLVEQNSGDRYDIKSHNKFNVIQTKMLWQFGIQKDLEKRIAKFKEKK